MGRIEKQKRLIIEQSNKRILGESNIDMGEVKELMKYKFPDVEVTDERIEEFNNWSEEVSDQLSNEEYANLLHDYIMKPNDNDVDGDPEHFDIIKKDDNIGYA